MRGNTVRLKIPIDFCSGKHSNLNPSTLNLVVYCITHPLDSTARCIDDTQCNTNQSTQDHQAFQTPCLNKSRQLNKSSHHHHKRHHFIIFILHSFIVNFFCKCGYQIFCKLIYWKAFVCLLLQIVGPDLVRFPNPLADRSDFFKSGGTLSRLDLTLFLYNMDCFCKLARQRTVFASCSNTTGSLFLRN